MKIIIERLCIAALTFMLGACSSTPSNNKPEPSVSTNTKTTLTAPEKQAYQMAINQLSHNEFDKAENGLYKLAQSHGDQLGIWTNLAMAYYKNGKIENAKTAVDNAIKLNPNLPDAFNLYGLVSVEQGKYQDAEKFYVKALSLNNNFANAHYNLALLYDVYFQDVAKALPHYQQYLALITEEDKETEKWVENVKENLKRKGAQ